MKSVSRNAPAMVVTEHTLQVPLDHAAPGGEQIDVFAREVVAPGREREQLPWLVYLQGGPGFESPRPIRGHDPTWLERALRDYRVLLLDQRGMGRSTPIGPGDAATRTPAELADRLTHHRADAIVADAEAFREALGVARWSILGQSFGGFCCVTYLSRAPESLREAFICGGLPPLDHGIDDVYALTYAQTIRHTRLHYQRYPEDEAQVAGIVKRLADDDLRLPTGDPLTPRRFRQVGHLLGMGDGSERLHYLLELPYGSPAFVHDVAATMWFDRNPLYAVVHESCYAPGSTTRWAADRVRPSAYDDDPTLLTGEHIYRWMFEEYRALEPFAATADVLADQAWPELYDPVQLASNEVPVAAAVYADDMYVPRAFSEETAGRIKGLRMWLTNEYEHDGLSAGGDKVLDRLMAMTSGRA
jgi:pimeloyl-ACP methyl ester carboxylesterase